MPLKPPRHLTYKNPGWSLLAIDPDSAFLDRFECVTTLIDFDNCNAETHRLCHVCIASRNHGKTLFQGHLSSPPVSNAKDVFGVVNLHCITVWYPVHGMSKKMVRMRDYGNPALSMNEIDRLFRALFGRRKCLYAQREKMTFGRRYFNSRYQDQVEPVLLDNFPGEMISFHCIVIGYRQPVKALFEGRIQYRLDAVSTIRTVGMDVKIEPETNALIRT